MGIRAWHRFLLALLPGLLISATVVAQDSARRTAGGPPLPPPDLEIVEASEPEEIVIGPSYYDPASAYYAAGPSCDVPSCGVYSPSPACNGGYDIAMNGCDCCQLWTVRAGAVFLRREAGEDIPIVIGTPSYDTSDLDFGYQGGPAVTFIRHGFLGTCWDLELNYFGVFSDASATTADVDSVNALPPIFVVGVAPALTTYDSNLHSTEINLRRQWNDYLTVLAGFRWIELSDDLNTNIGGGTAVFDMDVNNHIYGAQIGADARLWQRGCFTLEGYAKAGVFGNSADVDASTIGIGGALPLTSIDGNDTVFVGDLALTGVYQLNDCWSVRGGYQLLWIDGVALAPNQLDNVNIGTGLGTVDTSATTFYHGFTLAAELRF